MKIFLIFLSLYISIFSFNASAAYMIIEKKDIIYTEKGKENDKFKVSIKNTPGRMTLLTFTPGFQTSLEKHIINMENGDIKITGLGSDVVLKSDSYLWEESAPPEYKKEVENYNTFFYFSVRITFFFFLLILTFITIFKKIF